MFFLKELVHTINLHPQFFGPQIEKYVTQRLHEEVEGSCSGRYGAIVCIIEVTDIGKGVLQNNTGYAVYKVKYKAIVFKPFKNQVMDAIVMDVNNLGCFCQAGPLQIFISRQLIPEYLVFDANANPSAYVSQGQEFGDSGARIERGETLRVRVIGIRLEATKLIMVGSLQEDYLGPSQ